MKIAMLGTRGIPAYYSGFETCVEELAPRLVQKGYKVAIYCRKHYQRSKLKYYKNVKLITLPTIRNKYLDTFIHTFLSTLHVIFTDVDIVQYFGVGNSIFTIIPRIFGKKTFINVDGLDWTRKKWPYFAKIYLSFSAYLATFFPTDFITDSQKIVEYYKKTYNKAPHYIPYGTNIASPSQNAKHILDKFGLEKNKYILFTGRLVPENNIHHLISAFNKINTNLKLVIVGEGAYEKDYINSLKKNANPKIVFTGFLTGGDYKEICLNAYLFVEPTEASGTHPAILDAMGYGNCVLVNNIPTNLEVIKDAGFSYDGTKKDEDLKNKVEWLINNPEIVNEYKVKAIKHVKKNYSWDKVVNLYNDLYCYFKTSLSIR
jgi:glycosyltransferase involved in cell wall biosynthesis